MTTTSQVSNDEPKLSLKQKAQVYLKSLARDYKEAVHDIVKDAKSNPRRAFLTSVGLGFVTLCCLKNPDEDSFRQNVIDSRHEIMLLGKSIRNPNSVQHLQQLERCFNEGTIRRINLGMFSVIWIDNHNTDLAIYKAQCIYLRPQIFQFHKNITDIGFMGKWWILSKIMVNYDINPSEFLNLN